MKEVNRPLTTNTLRPCGPLSSCRNAWPRSASSPTSPFLDVPKRAICGRLLVRRDQNGATPVDGHLSPTLRAWARWPTLTTPQSNMLEAVNVSSGRCPERAQRRLDDAPPTALPALRVMPLTFTELDRHPVVVVDTEQDYREAVECLGVPFIFADDLLLAGGSHGITHPALSAVLTDYMLRIEDEETRYRPPPSAGT